MFFPVLLLYIYILIGGQQKVPEEARGKQKKQRIQTKEAVKWLFLFVHIFPRVKNIEPRDLDLRAWGLKLSLGFRV